MKEHQKLAIYFNTIGRMPRTRLFYKICQIYIRHYFGFNYGVDFDDGERWLASHVLAGRDSPTVFDVGANIGNWTLEILRICANAQIHSFEPIPDVYDRMTARVTAPNVKLNRLGVGAKHEVLEFYEYGPSQLSTLHARYDMMPKHAHLVNVVSVTEYCRDNSINFIDLLKIDTEGHDLFVLQGAKDLLKERQIEVVQFEYGPANIDSQIFLKDIFSYLSELPYKLFRLYPRYLLPILKYHTELENFINVNYVLIADDPAGNYEDIIRGKK